MRHSILALAIVCAPAAQAQSVCPGQFAGQMRVAVSAQLKAESFDLRDVRLLPGRFADNQRRDSAALAALPLASLLHSFRTNAGLYAGKEGGYMTIAKPGGWESPDCELRGHTTGHVLSALALMYASTGSERLRLKADTIVSCLAEVQQALGDGFVAAFPEQLVRRNLKGQSVWAPWYTLHKLPSGPARPVVLLWLPRGPRCGRQVRRLGLQIAERPDRGDPAQDDTLASLEASMRRSTTSGPPLATRATAGSHAGFRSFLWVDDVLLNLVTGAAVTKPPNSLRTYIKCLLPLFGGLVTAAPVTW